MIDPLNDTYTRLLHAMQSGVRAEIELGSSDAHTAKHLRTGVNSAHVTQSAIVKMLVDKGIFTMEEFQKMLISEMGYEVKRYEERLSNFTGKEIKLQ